MRLMKEPRGRLFSWYSYFSNYPLFLVLRVAVKRLQSKITQNTKKQTNSRKSRTGLHKTGARTEGGMGRMVHQRGELSRSRTSGWLVSEKRIYVEVLCVG